MISSIQLREDVKMRLARHKQKDNESFEDVIVRMMEQIGKQKAEQKALLIEQCRVMASDDLKIPKEWETTDASMDWKW